ncbi:hypothetical protein RJ641_017867 [Dillenia turbinata]|uniref:Uncharacterized protein n=1 Tax=Dillenia turbinata TaxID=194707 RepID=A0AAN8YXU9_9MAGN
MNHFRASSSPELLPCPLSNVADSNLGDVATNIKLLLKLFQDHNDATIKDNDDRRKHRLSNIMTILDQVKTRIQESESVEKKTRPELRRCNTELRCPRDQKPNEPINEKEKFRKELNASLAARKSLEVMCSSLGKEKKIMASELAKKVQEVNELEELVNDLKVQNEKLLGKVQTCAAKHKDKKYGGGETQSSVNAALQERNNALSEQLLKSLDGYRTLKRKLKEAQEENAVLQTKMDEIGKETIAGLNRIHNFRDQLNKVNEHAVDINEEISSLETMLEGFKIKVSNSKHEMKQGECIKPKVEIHATKPSVIA